MSTGEAKARGLGVPRIDVERVMAHYDISHEEAERWLRIHSVDELLPQRGAGLTRGMAAGVSSQAGSNAPVLFGLILGAGAIGILSVIMLGALSSRRK